MEFRQSTSNSAIKTRLYLNKNETSFGIGCIGSDSYPLARAISMTSNGITIGNTINYVGQTNNGALIPVKIYGFKNNIY